MPRLFSRARQISRPALSTALDSLAPERCLFCDQLSYRDLSLCEYCENALSRNTGACPSCALPHTRGSLCPQCIEAGDDALQVVAPFVYDPMIAHLMHRWKYNGERRLSRTVAKLILKSDIMLPSADIALSTPLYWRRLVRRGFNQSQDLLEDMRRLSDTDELPRSVRTRFRRTRSTPSQAHASRRQRSAQINQVFRASGVFEGQSVTVVDDVCTTGSTARAMKSALQAAGARRFTLLCLARTPTHQ